MSLSSINMQTLLIIKSFHFLSTFLVFTLCSSIKTSLVFLVWLAPSKLFLSVGLVSHIKQRFEIATLLDQCVTSGNDLVQEYQRPIRNLFATHRSIRSPSEFISFPIRLSDPFLRRIKVVSEPLFRYCLFIFSSPIS